MRPGPRLELDLLGDPRGVVRALPRREHRRLPFVLLERSKGVPRELAPTSDLISARECRREPLQRQPEGVTKLGASVHRGTDILPPINVMYAQQDLIAPRHARASQLREAWFFEDPHDAIDLSALGSQRHRDVREFPQRVVEDTGGLELEAGLSDGQLHREPTRARRAKHDAKPLVHGGPRYGGIAQLAIGRANARTLEARALA